MCIRDSSKLCQCHITIIYTRLASTTNYCHHLLVLFPVKGTILMLLPLTTMTGSFGDADGTAETLSVGVGELGGL